MKPELLYSIADVINTNGDTYRAVVPYAKHDYMVQEGSRLVRSSCYVLRVMLSGKPKNHVRRAVWNIYEGDMDKIIQKISRRDKAFAERMNSCKPSPRDVEWIVRRATLKSLTLKISNSSYYLYVGSDR